jgi:hypothetical protein
MSLQTIPGRDGRGRTIPLFTKAGGVSGVMVDKWHVNICFAREDHSQLPDDWKTVEWMARKGQIPKVPLWANTHIIRAVRMCAHIRVNYLAEARELARQCGVLRDTNALLAKGTKKDIEAALDSLALFREYALDPKRVALKSIIAKGRLFETCDMLELVKVLQGSSRAMELNRARAVLVSLENRICRWRPEEMKERSNRNFRRECFLRFERDQWLLSRLDAFAANPFEIRRYEDFDQFKHIVLAKIRAMLELKAPKEEVLAYLKETSPLFCVLERNPHQIKDKIYKMEHGSVPTDAKNSDYLKGHYLWLYDHIKNGLRDLAKDRIKHLELFVDANKPGFITRELSEGADSYLKGTVELIKGAVEAYDRIQLTEAGHLFTAVTEASHLFAAARDEMKRAISNPPPSRIDKRFVRIEHP